MDTPQANVTNQSLEAENARLRARIRELESEPTDTGSSPRPRRRRTRAISEETEDNLRDVPSHAMDELGRLGRGLSYAVAEGFRVTSDLFSCWADEVSAPRSQRRSRHAPSVRSGANVDTEGDTESEPQVASTVADDLVAGVASGIHEVIDGPRRVVESFMDAYQEDPKPSGSGESRSRSGDDKARRVRSRVKE